MKKKCLALFCALFLLLTLLPVSAADLSYTVEEKTLMHGLTYRHLYRLMDTGWQDIYVVQADLTQPHLKFDVLSNPEGKSYLQNTFESAKTFDALAAVNADFFASKSGQYGRGSAIGLEINAGELLTSPAAYESMNALYQPQGKTELLFSPFTYDFSVIAPDGSSAPIDVINKFDSMTGIVLYTPAWGNETPGSAGNVLEVVVENDTVIAINQDTGAVPIPKNGYVLACDISMNRFLPDSFNIGSPVKLKITTAPNFEDIETAVGGGGMILTNGRIPSSYSHTIGGTHPRTAIGVDQAGTQLTMVVVDGRRDGATGMTMTQLGYLMADLGCYNAMNLDGGGSSLMAIKQEDGSHAVVNTPSDGGHRPVTNSVGILANTPTPSEFSAVRIGTKSTSMYANDSLPLQLEKLDQYGRVMGYVPATEVSWTVLSGSGRIENGSFFPAGAGSVVIRGQAGVVFDEITVTVSPDPSDTDPQKRPAALTGSGFTFTVFGDTRKQEKFFDIYLNNAVTKAVKKENGNHFFVGNRVEKSLLSRLGNTAKTADGFSKFTQSGSTFITLQNTGGISLFAGGKTQWSELELATNNLAGGNLFVFLNDTGISPLSAEQIIFKQLMKKAATKCANVYVFSGGNTNQTLIEDGVRYVTVAGISPDIGYKPEDTNIAFVEYYLVTVNGDTVTYETKSIKN